MSKVTQKGNDADDLLTTAQVSEATGWSVAQINRKAATGELVTAVKAPGPRGARLFHPSAVAAIGTKAEPVRRSA